MEQILVSNLPIILLIVVFLIMWFAYRDTAVGVIKWFAAILTEPDGNGGKASVSRVIGTYVAWNIIQQSWTGKAVDPVLWDMFMITLGYMFVSKALNGVSPAILDFASGFKAKYQQKPTP